MQPELPIEFVVHGTPVSLQASARSRRNWKRTIETAAASVIPGGTWLIEQPLAVTIFYFRKRIGSLDLDNIVKPILDALCTTVYVDDQQVERIVAQRLDVNAPDRLIAPTPTLIRALDAPADVLYIRIADVPQEASL